MSRSQSKKRKGERFAKLPLDEPQQFPVAVRERHAANMRKLKEQM